MPVGNVTIPPNHLVPVAGAFEDSEEEATAVVEEFYAEAVTGADTSAGEQSKVLVPKTAKLTVKLASTEPVAA